MGVVDPGVEALNCRPGSFCSAAAHGRCQCAGAHNRRMVHELALAGESGVLAAALRSHLIETRFGFDGLTGKEATRSITCAVAQWARASGWRSRWEAPMRYIDPPRELHGGCRIVWSPPWSAFLDLRLLRSEGPAIAVEIDREDDSTAVDKLRDEALRGRPALWVRWHGAVRAELPAGVARLHLPSRSSRSPVRYTLAPVTDTAAISLGRRVTAEAHADALHRDRERRREEERVAALPRPAGPIW